MSRIMYVTDRYSFAEQYNVKALKALGHEVIVKRATGSHPNFVAEEIQNDALTQQVDGVVVGCLEELCRGNALGYTYKSLVEVLGRMDKPAAIAASASSADLEGLLKYGIPEKIAYIDQTNERSSTPEKFARSVEIALRLTPGKSAEPVTARVPPTKSEVAARA